MQLFEYRPLPPDETTIRLIRLIGRNTDAPHPPEPTPSATEDGSSQTDSDTPPPDSGDVFHAPIASAPPYVALSYVWGDPMPRHTVRFGAAIAHIPDNLHAALQYLQPKKADAPAVNVWIDALCINQSDPLEKAQQIGHMREIYGRASAVVSWLGSAADDSDVAMRWVDHYGGQACRLGIGSKKELYLRRLLYALDHEDRQTAEGRGVHRHADHRDHHDHHTGVLENKELECFVRNARDQLAGETDEARRALTALRHLFLRDYWSRVWVIQEVKQGAGVTFVCGDLAVPEDNVHHALRLMRNFAQYAKFSGAAHDAAQQPNPERDVAALSAPRPLQRTNTELFTQHDPDVGPLDDPTPSLVPTAKAIKLLKARRANGSFELAYLLRNFWGAGATDSRDHIFALLGLARDGEALGIKPDYIKPLSQVFTDTTEALYKAGYMDLLAYCRPLEDGAQGDDRPSWVPRYEDSPTRERLQQRGILRNTAPIMSVLQPEFSASGDHKATCVFSSPLSSTPFPSTLPRTMTCPAILLGEVGSLGSIWKPHDVGRWLQDLANLSQSIYNPSQFGSSGSNQVNDYVYLELLRGQGDSITRESAHLRAVLRTAVADQELRRGATKPRLSEELLNKAAVMLGYNDSLVSLSVEALVERGLKTYVQQLEASAAGRRPFAGDGVLFGIGPCEMEHGDLIYVLSGATVPYVLRRDAQGQLRMVGDAYVHGKMDGEVMKGCPDMDTIMIH